VKSLVRKFKLTRLGSGLVEQPLVSTAWLRARSLPHYATHGHVARSRTVERYLASTNEPRLQLGAGGESLPGWLNSDLVSGDIYLDITNRLPLPDGSFAYVFAEHVIEHISESAGQALMAELRRVLRPGGVLRLTTPDLEKIIALYQDRNPVISLGDYARFLDEMTGRPHDSACQVFNDFLRLWGHRYIYDEEDCRAKLGLLASSTFSDANQGRAPIACCAGSSAMGPTGRTLPRRCA
jgi:predicted SAM-dependent methyltransferase